MSSKVTLTITSGNLKGREFTFDSRTTCIIGRAKDCYPKIPDDEKHRTISRYHCLLDINPPDIRVQGKRILNLIPNMVQWKVDLNQARSS
jgi:pSer/pThr/pTyr-binding forkhead associated (FHA) protein